MKEVVLVILGILIGNAKSCTWIRGDSCYTYVSSGLPFWSAETECATAYSGNLVTVNDLDEDDFIRMRLIDMLINKDTINDTIAIWTGGYLREGVYAWTSGEEFSYSNWASNQPDNMGGTEDVIAYTWYSQWNWHLQWNDWESDDEYPFICESRIN